MIKRSFAVLAIIVIALITSTALPTLSTTEAAGAQRIIWNATGLQQTSSTYWEPTLDQPSNYVSPVDLVGGRAYMRLDVLEKPSDMLVVPMICFWRHGAKKFAEETCAAGNKHPFTTEGTYYLDLGATDSWWQKNREFDWTKPVSLGRIMIRDGVKGGRLLLNERCGGACYLGDDLDDHIPITMSSQLIFVARGQTLSPPSGWHSGCPGSWASACQGEEVTPVTTTPSPTTTTPSTSPGTTTTTVPTPTTVPGPARIDVEPGITSLDVSYSIPRAALYQVRYAPDGGKTVWTDPTKATSRTLRNLKPGKQYTVSVRGLINGTWRNWMSTTGTPLESGGPGPGDTTTTTTPGTTVPTPTTPGTTTTTVPTPTTVPGPARIDVEPGITSLDVSYSIPRAALYQVRYAPDGGKTVWTDPTKATSRTLRNLKPGKQYTVSVRGLINGTWRNWMSTTGTPLESGGPGPGDTTTTTTPGTTVPTPTTAPPTTAAPGDAYLDVKPGVWILTASYGIPQADLYQVRYRQEGRQTQWTSPTEATSQILPGLNPGKLHTVEVRGLVNGTWRNWISTTATPLAG